MSRQYLICRFFVSNISVVQPFCSCPHTDSTLACVLPVVCPGYYSCHVSSSDQHHATTCPDHCLKDRAVLLLSCVIPLLHPSPHLHPCSARYKVLAFTFKYFRRLCPLHLPTRQSTPTASHSCTGFLQLPLMLWAFYCAVLHAGR